MPATKNAAERSVISRACGRNWKRSIVPTTLADYNCAVGRFRQPHAPFPDRHAGHGRPAFRALRSPTCASTIKDGALGIVVNKPIDMTLSALFEQIEIPLDDDALRDAPVHFGGPVQVDRGFVLHRPLGNWQSTLAINDDLGLTTSKDVLEAVGRGEGPKRFVRVARLCRVVGGQLEQELAQNAWLTVEADPGVLFDAARRGAAARRDAAARHRLLAAVRGRRARVTRVRRRSRTRRCSRSISARGASASPWAIR